MAKSNQAAATFYLVVVHAFGIYRRGDSITDKTQIQAVLAGENAANVNRVSL